MKKILITLCLLMIMVGCSNNNTIANPLEKHDSLEEINEITHGNIKHPGVMGISDEEFYTITTNDGIIAEYDFNAYGFKYTIRFSDTILDEDISGVYINSKPAFKDKEEKEIKGEGMYLSRWFTVDGQYVIMTEDTVKKEVFSTIAEEMKSLSANR